MQTKALHQIFRIVWVNAMSKHKNKKKSTGVRMKNQAEKASYRQFLSDSSIPTEGTLPVYNKMLQGTAELPNNDSDVDVPKDIINTPVKYRLADWLKKNIFPTIVASILLAIGGAVIAHMVDIAVIKKQIDYIEKKVEQLDENCVDKEKLELKLSELESSVDNKYVLPLNEIRWQLDDIEKELDSLSLSIHGND